VKRLASVLGAFIILATAVVPAGATMIDGLPSANAGARQIAFATWLVHEDGQPVIYFGVGMNLYPSAPSTSIGFVGRAPCHEVERRGHKSMRCSGRARGHELLPGEFVFDPLLESATMTLEAGGTVHSVNWEGKGTAAEPYWHQHAGPGFNAMAMVMASRRARAVGTVFGRDLEGGRAVLFEMITADVWMAIPQMPGTQIRLTDGLLRVRANL
jgi:hypothetical protein